jgi:hypothetical protein
MLKCCLCLCLPLMLSFSRLSAFLHGRLSVHSACEHSSLGEGGDSSLSAGCRVSVETARAATF